MKKNYFIQKTLLLLLLLDGTGWIYKANSQNGWEERTPLNSVRGQFATCVIDNDIYLFGGLDESDSFLATAEKYNTETGVTTPLAQISIPLALPTADVINNKIYLVGGFKDNNTGSNLVHEYDPGADSWTLKKELPLRIGHHKTCVLYNKLYVFGGRLNEGAKNEFQAFVYDPAADKWDSIAPMHNNQERCQSSSILFDNEMYVFGGHELLNPNIYTNTVEKYDPDEDEWTVLNNMPEASGWHANAVYMGKIYLFGGHINSHYGKGTYEPTVKIWEYDPEGDSLKRMMDMPFTSTMFGEQVGQYLYMLGGCDNNSLIPSLKEVWRFNLDSLVPYTTTSINQFFKTMDQLFFLHHNHPNPFSGSTTIRYELNRSGEVEMLVYDMLGKKIVSLVDQFQLAGSYDVRWNAEGIKPGVYYCELKLAGYRQTSKMMVTQ